MESQVVLRIVTKFLVPLILLFGLYVQFHGDYGPGGGFQAGVIFASGAILYGLVFGLPHLREAIPPAAIRRIIPIGVLLYAGVGLVGILRGRSFLDYAALDPGNPVHGQHLGILLVELGVGITVAAVMISFFYAFATRGRSDSRRREQAAHESDQ